MCPVAYAAGLRGTHMPNSRARTCFWIMKRAYPRHGAYRAQRSDHRSSQYVTCLLLKLHPKEPAKVVETFHWYRSSKPKPVTGLASPEGYACGKCLLSTHRSAQGLKISTRAHTRGKCPLSKCLPICPRGLQAVMQVTRLKDLTPGLAHVSNALF